MKSHTCLLIDDEPIAMDILQTYLQRLDNVKLIGRFTNPIKAFQALQKNPVDLLFLDIQMPELTGLELLQSLRYKPAVILTTAYREFALEGFEFDVLDYLLKPISFDRFLKAIDKFYSRTPSVLLPEKQHKQQTDETPAHFFVRADRKNVKILLEDILYLESLKDYVKIVTTQGAVLTKETITHFDETLPTGQFLRTHRSFIVATKKVTALSTDGLEVQQVTIPVGRMYKLAVEKAILG
ncbi:MAG: response regulator transcription factor [Lewinellaceae bacterium]|nr:response regulator transcription factor [Saprospiraceae bacterium]MCB9330486.1 response regulator transcription factor [Lewinellaceae bacterium]